jgi:NADH:ubiquinone oxidoreductase subunit F (NADH-binding)
MKEILNHICELQATPADRVMLEQLSDLLRNASLCGLGQSAPNSVMSTLRYFEEEYRAHIEDHRCPAGVCGKEREGAA